jgi:hypothetical protein
MLVSPNIGKYINRLSIMKDDEKKAIDPDQFIA